MGAHIGGGWQVVHKTDRTIELRKEDATYRHIYQRDGYVLVRGEPGIDPALLMQRAIEQAQASDAALAETVAAQIMPKHVTRYQNTQRQLAQAFGTPEDREVIGAKRP